MSCGCQTLNQDGKEIVDFVRSKGKDNTPMQVAHEITCECGEKFIMKTVVDRCPSCKMTYGVTPCGSASKEGIRAAGINY